MNVSILRGVLSRDPALRVLPSESRLVAYEVTNRDTERTRADTVPVVWHEPASALRLQAGDEVVVVGRVVRRFFRTGGSTASRTEVVADAVYAAREKARITKALKAVSARLSPS